jgi:glycosyltransferase involved in cell wall biosynthesis
MGAQAAKVLAEFCHADDPRPAVIIATDRCAPARGGVQTYVEGIAECLSDQFRFLILTATRDAASLDDAVVRPEPPAVGRLGHDNRSPFVVAARLGPEGADAHRRRRSEEDAANTAQPSSYHAHRWETMTRLARLLANELGEIRSHDVVVHAMGPWEMSLTASYIFPASRRVVTPFIHPGHWGDDPDSLQWLASADHIVALTPADEQVCLSLGLRRDRTTVVPVPYRRRHGRAAPHRNVVAFVGVDRPYKGADLFAEAAERLAPEWPDVRFLLVTSPPQGGSPAADDRPVAGVRRVTCPSDIERDRLLRRAVCVVLPSATEISPYVVLEAWDHGATVIVTDDAHFRSFVEHGGTFVTRDVDSVASAIAHQLARPAEARHRADVGRQRLDRLHAPPLAAAVLADLYRGVGGGVHDDR